MSKEEALGELERGAGTQCGPSVVEAFMAWVNEGGGHPAVPSQPAGEVKELAAPRTTTA